MSPGRRPLAGILLLLSLFAAIAAGTLPGWPGWPAGLLGWTAGGLLFPDIAPRTRRVVLMLFTIGLIGIAQHLLRTGEWVLLRAVSGNQALIALLAAVSYLRLLNIESPGEQPRQPTGLPAMLQTLFGVHLFGAVINLSSVFIMGDRLSRHRPLQHLQALILSRGMASAAFWSPFFASTAVTLTYAPGADFFRIMPWGVLLAAVAHLLTSLQFYLGPERQQVAEFEGYPLRPATLWLPAVLAAGVIVIAWTVPTLSVLTIITIVAPLLTGLLLLHRLGLRQTGEQLVEHTCNRLPNMAGELLLFLSAGVLACGLELLFAQLPPGLAPAALTTPLAGLAMLVMVALALVGVHPIISITTFGTWATPLHPDPNMLALMFLMTWGLAVGVSPFSGIQLSIQGRYGISGQSMMKGNLIYSLPLTAAALILLFVRD
ncbi:MAG: hypothetical protein J4A00_07350 [Gammaproteobacteria bacterium]|nr:hypothetical protein [Gammaproteobacteria bacterium]